MILDKFISMQSIQYILDARISIFAEPRIGPDQGATDKEEEEEKNSCTFLTRHLIGWHDYLKDVIGPKLSPSKTTNSAKHWILFTRTSSLELPVHLGRTPSVEYSLHVWLVISPVQTRRQHEREQWHR